MKTEYTRVYCTLGIKPYGVHLLICVRDQKKVVLAMQLVISIAFTCGINDSYE
jgi:hypothetical protein